MKLPKSGGGWQAIRYTWRKGREVGLLRLWRAMRAKNACKTCALGMGGQLGGMTNEAGHFPELCKKSLQAMAADMRGRIEPRFFETYSVRDLQQMSPRELEYVGRLTTPVLLEPGSTHYRPISWDDAIGLVTERMRRTEPERTFFYSSGRSSNEAGFLLQLFARAFGTNHICNCSTYCHQASGVGLKDSVGTGTATVALEDIDQCDCLFLIGGNPASNHPRFMEKLIRIRRRGGQIIVINPLKETGLVNFKVPSNVKSMLLGSEIASLYLQPRIGGDIAFLAGIAKALLAANQVDRAYLDAYTEGFDELVGFLEALTWEEVEIGSGISRSAIEGAARVYAKSENAIFAWTMGITHHEHGVQNVQWIANLALLRGMVGKPGAGLLPIRGHSNVQGLGSMGVAPALSKAALEKLESLGLRPPAWVGYDTLSALEAAQEGKLDFVLALGGNLYGASPDATFMKAAFEEIDTAVYLTTTLNTGHAHGLARTTLILPVKARDEESQSTTQESMFNYVRLSDGGPSRYEGPLSEVEVIASLAEKLVTDSALLKWSELSDHEAIRALIARLVPGYGEVEKVGETKKEFHIPGRLFRKPVFPTPSGRAQLRSHPLPAGPLLNEGQFLLMTIRSEGQFNTVVYEEEDIYRGQERRDVILLNSVDMEALGLEADHRVRVVGEAGEMRQILARPFDIARGCAAMYFPESNVLLSVRADPRSRTPAYKAGIVTVVPESKGISKEELDHGEVLEHVAKQRTGMKAC